MKHSLFHLPRSAGIVSGRLMVAAAGVALMAGMPKRAVGADAAPDPVPSTLLARNEELASLANMSPEELMKIPVTILGPSQTVSRTPAAVSVVTADDIQRSGAQNLPEALRLVPGLDVAQMDAAQWAVSVRGFNDQFANKLLVLQDGRSLYTPLFAGVVWDVQGTMLEDIDHIEVVRGPGATLWGANAMNGVINILTKNAADTQGWLVRAGGGNQDLASIAARYGGKIGDAAYYRLYATYNAHDNADMPGGGSAHDPWQLGRAGWRTDWNAAGGNTLTFQGDGYLGGVDEMLTIYDPASPTLSSQIRDDMRVGGANALGRWRHTISDSADFQLQAYYDFTTRDAARVFDEQRHTFDLSWQNEFAAGDRHRIVWGLGYRVTADQQKNSDTIQFNPLHDTVNLFSGFAQDEIALVPERLSLTLGSKLEHNDYTGWEVEPGARLRWTPWRASASRALASQTFWASVSRAVRTPSRAEEAIMLFQPNTPSPGVTTVISGNTGFESETMLAYEIGWRAALTENLSVDAAAFYNDYHRLRSLEPTGFSLGPPPTASVYLANGLTGDSYGAELSATWRPAFAQNRWRLTPAYSFLKMNLHPRAGSSDTTSAAQSEGQSPQNQFSMRSSLDLPGGVTADAALRFVDSLKFPQQGVSLGSYWELDARLAWRINPHLEISLVGHNLLHGEHQEFIPTELAIQPAEIPRSVFGEITWQF